MRVFLDANILFSAAVTDGSIRRLIHDLIRAGHQCLADGFVWEEARRNLVARPQAIEYLHTLSTLVILYPGFAGSAIDFGDVKLPEKDQPVLAAAVALRCECLVTGDRLHFGPFFGHTVAGVAIHSPRSLAEALLG